MNIIRSSWRWAMPIGLVLAGCHDLPNVLTGTTDPPLGDLSPASEPQPSTSGPQSSPVPSVSVPLSLEELPLQDDPNLAQPSSEISPSSLASTESSPVAQSEPTQLLPLPEPTQPVIALPLGQEPNQSQPSDSLAAVPLAGNETSAFLDIRGVGDAGMANTHQQPLPPTFGQRLDAFDRTGKSYRGDLSFINWESTVGTRCNQFWAPRGPSAFAFVSHPDNIVQLYQRGFNLIGLANNHTRDCPNAEEGVKGDLASARHMERISQTNQANWLWHGVGTRKAAVVQTFQVKGKPVRVAFASLYLNAGDCTYVTCLKDKLTVLRSLRDAPADLRVLALHSWTSQTQTKDLVNLGVSFLRHYDGDIVFGHGHFHRWGPVRVVESARGDKRGVMFESLGNFIHPSLVPRSQHLIGRALFDLETLKLRQVQAIPIALNRVYASFGGTPNPTKLPANLTWKFIQDPTWQSGVSAQVKAAYANIQP